MIYFMLFYQFFLIGLLALGGGAATIPFLFDLSKKYGWFSALDLTNMIAISESTPGPLGVNMATFAGYQTAGVLGGIVATLGLVTPSLIIVLCLIKLVQKFSCNEALNTLLKLVQPAVLALILNAAVQIGLIGINSLLPFFIFTFIFILMFCYKASPVFYIILSALLGIIFEL